MCVPVARTVSLFLQFLSEGLRIHTMYQDEDDCAIFTSSSSPSADGDERRHGTPDPSEQDDLLTPKHTWDIRTAYKEAGLALGDGSPAPHVTLTSVPFSLYYCSRDVTLHVLQDTTIVPWCESRDGVEQTERHVLGITSPSDLRRNYPALSQALRFQVDRAIRSLTAKELKELRTQLIISQSGQTPFAIEPSEAAAIIATKQAWPYDPLASSGETSQADTDNPSASSAIGREGEGDDAEDDKENIQDDDLGGQARKKHRVDYSRSANGDVLLQIEWDDTETPSGVIFPGPIMVSIFSKRGEDDSVTTRREEMGDVERKVADMLNAGLAQCLVWRAAPQLRGQHTRLMHPGAIRPPKFRAGPTVRQQSSFYSVDWDDLIRNAVGRADRGGSPAGASLFNLESLSSKLNETRIID